MELGTQVTIGLAIVGALVWAVRQEGRVNNHDTLHQEHVKRAEEIRSESARRSDAIRAESLDRDTEMRVQAASRYDELRSEMQYFRQRVDAWFGPGKHP